MCEIKIGKENRLSGSVVHDRVTSFLARAPGK